MKEEHWKQVIVALSEKIKQMETHLLLLELENKQLKEKISSQSANKCSEVTNVSQMDQNHNGYV